MNVPKSFKKNIERVFYDKIIKVLKYEEITDTEGGIVVKAEEIIDNFKGNVNISNFKLLQESYGLDYEVDIAITTNYNKLKLNDIIEYNDVKYQVTDNIASDSHYMVVGKIWRL